MNENTSARDLKTFFEENYQLFTIISVFGALSAYLSQLAGSQPQAERFGIGAVLVLFAITTILAVSEAYDEFELAREDSNYKLMIGYGVINYSFIALVGSITIFMLNNFPEGSGSVIFAGTLYASVFVYIQAVITHSYFTEQESESRIIQFLTRKSPHVSLVLLAVLYIYSPEMPPIIRDDLWQSVGFIVGIIFVHIIFTLIIFLLLKFVDYIQKSLIESVSMPF